jgi:hypothetical protein
VTYLSGREAIDFLLYELPSASIAPGLGRDEEAAIGEQTPLLRPSRTQLDGVRGLEDAPSLEDWVQTNRKPNGQDSFAASFENLNALEIGAVCQAKKFLSQRVVQRIIESIWRGDIVFWETLSVDSKKEPKIYNKKRVFLIGPRCSLE